METNTTPVTTTSVSLRFGLLTGLVSIIYMFVLFVSNAAANTAAQWVGLIIPIVGIYLAHQNYKVQNGGFIAYGQGLGIGVLLSAFSGLLTGVFNYVYRTIIDPEMAGRMMEAVRAKMEEAGNMTDEQVDAALKMSAKFSSGPIGIVFGVLATVFTGFILSLIISAFTKHAQPEFE